MARRKAARGVKKAKGARKRSAAGRLGKRPKAAGARASVTRRAKPSRRAKAGPKKKNAVARAPARLDRARRTLDDTVMGTPPSSLDMDRRGTAARTGRAEIAQSRQVHGTMTRAITGGDVDVNLENAYFSGDEAPGGDNPTPDQDIVDDIGKAIGVEYQDNEELRSSDKVVQRDKHRWELDPASSEDYKDRK
jgi:hypothetical protein